MGNFLVSRDLKYEQEGVARNIIIEKMLVSEQ
jgi:hypothetical protein